MKNEKCIKRVLYIEPCAGLGNRLYALASAWYWTEEMGFELRIVWKKENPCAVRFDAIFERNSEYIVKEINQKFTKKIQEISHVYSNAWLYLTRRKCKFISNEELGIILKEKGFEGIRQIFEGYSYIYIKSTKQFAPEEEMAAAWRAHMSFNKELVERASNTIDGLENENGGCIGVHIRRTDNVAAINGSSTQCFEAAIRNELEHDSNLKVYVATDDNDERLNLISKFGDAIIKNNPYSKKVSRVTDAGLKDAVVEMLCLSMCQRIYGSFGSTFSQWAARIGNIELIVVS